MVVHHVPRLVKWMFPNFTWNKSRDKKKIYLTFDDGPVPGVTDFVLDELGCRGIKATFFVVGDNVRKYSRLAKRLVQEGHQIGNHTYNHLKGSATDNVTYWSNLQKCTEVVEEVTGVKPYLFRPPYGRIKKKQAEEISQKYEIIMWDVLSGDYVQGQSAETCLSKTIRYTRNGAIILFHDQKKTEKIIKTVLPKYLDYIQREGYETVLL